MRQGKTFLLTIRHSFPHMLRLISLRLKTCILHPSPSQVRFPPHAFIVVEKFVEQKPLCVQVANSLGFREAVLFTEESESSTQNTYKQEANNTQTNSKISNENKMVYLDITHFYYTILPSVKGLMYIYLQET